jgi:hypothetical protein
MSKLIINFKDGSYQVIPHRLKSCHAEVFALTPIFSPSQGIS